MLVCACVCASHLVCVCMCVSVCVCAPTCVRPHVCAWRGARCRWISMPPTSFISHLYRVSKQATERQNRQKEREGGGGRWGEKKDRQKQMPAKDHIKSHSSRTAHFPFISQLLYPYWRLQRHCWCFQSSM